MEIRIMATVIKTLSCFSFLWTLGLFFPSLGKFVVKKVLECCDQAKNWWLTCKMPINCSNNTTSRSLRHFQETVFTNQMFLLLSHKVVVQGVCVGHAANPKSEKNQLEQIGQTDVSSQENWRNIKFSVRNISQSHLSSCAVTMF